MLIAGSTVPAITSSSDPTHAAQHLLLLCSACSSFMAAFKASAGTSTLSVPMCSHTGIAVTLTWNDIDVPVEYLPCLSTYST